MKETIFIFDIGNVLLNLDLGGLQAAMAESATEGLDCVRAEWNHPDFVAVESGALTAQAYFERVCARTGLTWSYDQWVSQWAKAFTQNPVGQGLREILRNQGRSVAVLSNLGDHHTCAIKQAFPDFFTEGDTCFYSYKLELVKPDPAIYQEVCAHFGVAPEQCVFIDDVLANVQGAQSIGMHAMQLGPDNAEQVEAFVYQFVQF